MGDNGRTSSRRAWLVGVALVLLTTVAATMAARVNAPAEDAAMLLRYSVNVANGHGVVFNPGGEHVDGATDMGLMVGIAALVALGASASGAMAALNVAALVAIAGALYAFAVRRGCPLWFAVLLPASLTLGRSLRHVQDGFGAPVFGLAVLALWLLVEEARRRPDRRGVMAGVGAAGVVAGLVRPEGFLLTGLALLSLAATLPRSTWRRFLPLVAVVLVGGAVFEAWRWSYFGHPLPNPFYVKGGGYLHPSSLVHALTWSVVLGWLPLGVVALGLITRPTRRLAVAQAVGVGGSILMWVLLSNAMNLNGRFQYPSAIIAAVCAAVLFPRVWEVWSGVLARRGPTGSTLAVVAASAVAVLIAGQLLTVRSAVRRGDEPIQATLAGVLQRHDAPGRVVVTTEAGLIPLRSGWHAVDAYGLNDRRIAQSGTITAERLASEDPDVIVVHGAYVDATDAWSTMVRQLIDYAESSGYRTAVTLPIGERDWDWVIYVRPDAPDADELVAALAAADYA